MFPLKQSTILGGKLNVQKQDIVETELLEQGQNSNFHVVAVQKRLTCLELRIGN